MSGETWVKIQAIKGGHVVVCRLCGKSTRRFFHAENTNYAEALRLATAYESTHRLSEAHAAAVAAFHSDEVPESSKEELLLAEIFGGASPSERDRRKRAARGAAKEWKP